MVASREKKREREKRVWQELLNWSFDWTHRDGLNVISDWPEARSAERVVWRARRVNSVSADIGPAHVFWYPSSFPPHLFLSASPSRFPCRSLRQKRGIRWTRPIDSIASIKGTSNRARKFRPASFSCLRKGQAERERERENGQGYMRRIHGMVSQRLN